MDEIGEQMQVADEISEAISNPIGGAMEDDVRRLLVSRAHAPPPCSPWLHVCLWHWVSRNARVMLSLQDDLLAELDELDVDEDIMGEVHIPGAAAAAAAAPAPAVPSYSLPSAPDGPVAAAPAPAAVRGACVPFLALPRTWFPRTWVAALCPCAVTDACATPPGLCYACAVRASRRRTLTPTWQNSRRSQPAWREVVHVSTLSPVSLGATCVRLRGASALFAR